MTPTPGSFSQRGGGEGFAYLPGGPPPNPKPAITSLSPNAAAAGSVAFSLTVNGTGFISSSVVRWNGTARTTTYVSSTQLQAAITAADVATAGTANVMVYNPTPGGGTSTGVRFTVS
jgi:hypothetical protein